MHQVHTFVNPYKKSNNHVIEINDREVVIIDFGNYPLDVFVKWILTNQKKIVALILTHEHADHCYGVDSLKKKFEFDLYCSKECEINMRNPKQNYSRYIEEFETFGVESPAIIIEDGQTLDFNGCKFQVIHTPGHSPGSICLLSDFGVFSGDTLLNDVKSPLSFPHSNKQDYQKSLKRLNTSIEEGKIIYPGHDLKYSFKKMSI
jgi:hydroxyacylglutathione hydrolase